MKKELLTVLLSVVTVITIYFVGFWEPNANIDKKENKNITYMQESKNNENETSKSEENKLLDKEIQKEKDEKSNKDNDIDSSNVKNKNEIVESKNSGEENNISKKSKESVETNVQIFNINKEDIINNLNLSEKTKLFSIAKKLSVVDAEKIKSSINGKSELEGIKEVFRIIKLRLTTRDYNEVKEILSPYINIEFLEELV